MIDELTDRYIRAKETQTLNLVNQAAKLAEEKMTEEFGWKGRMFQSGASQLRTTIPSYITDLLTNSELQRSLSGLIIDLQKFDPFFNSLDIQFIADLLIARTWDSVSNDKSIEKVAFDGQFPQQCLDDYYWKSLIALTSRENINAPSPLQGLLNLYQGSRPDNFNDFFGEALTQGEALPEDKTKWLYDFGNDGYGFTPSKNKTLCWKATKPSNPDQERFSARQLFGIAIAARQGQLNQVVQLNP